jgi:hypothetical protein
MGAVRIDDDLRLKRVGTAEDDIRVCLQPRLLFGCQYDSLLGWLITGDAGRLSRDLLRTRGTTGNEY